MIRLKNKNSVSIGIFNDFPINTPAVEHTGFEPVASTMRMLRAPNCANAP